MNGPRIRQGGAGHFSTGETVEDRHELRRIVRRRDRGDLGCCRVRHGDAVSRADHHLGLAVAIHVVNRHVVRIADADGGRAWFVGVLVHAVRPHVHLPEESAVALVGLQVLVRLAKGGEPVHEVVVFSIAVEITHPAEFHIIGSGRAAGDRLERKREKLLGQSRRRDRVGGAGHLFHAADDRFDIIGNRIAGQVRRAGGVGVIGGGRDRRGVQLGGGRTVDRPIDIERDVIGIGGEQTPAEIGLGGAGFQDDETAAEFFHLALRHRRRGEE